MRYGRSRHHEPLRAFINVDAYGQYIHKQLPPQPFPIEKWKSVAPEQLDALAASVAAETDDEWTRCCSGDDTEAMWDAWNSAAERFLVLRSGDLMATHGARRYRGRAHVQPPRRTFVTAPLAKGDGAATTLWERRLSNITGRLRELETQLAHIQPGPTTLPKRTHDLWRRARATLSRMPIRYQPEFTGFDTYEIGSIPLASTLITKLRLECATQLDEHQKQQRGYRIQQWRDRMRENDKKHPGRIHQRCNGKFRSLPFATLLRDDGSLTSNVEELDDALRAAWLPIFQRYSTSSPEPSWEPFRDEYKEFFPRAPLDLTDITGDMLRETI
eukprot:gene9168-1659_t